MINKIQELRNENKNLSRNGSIFLLTATLGGIILSIFIPFLIFIIPIGVIYSIFCVNRIQSNLLYIDILKADLMKNNEQ